MTNSRWFVRHDLFLVLTVFLASMILYVRTLAPGLLYGDSAEFQTLAYTLGIAHPNGYPIFVALMRLFTAFFRFGDLAWRVNLLSAVCGSLTAVLVYLVVKLLSNSSFGALAGSVILVINPIFWWNSILIETYVPSAMCVALVVLLTLLWRHTGHSFYLGLAGLVGGLGLGIHSTVPVMAPAVLLFLALSARTRKAWLAALVGAGIGFALVSIVFLAIDANAAPSSYYMSTVRHALSVWNMTPSDFDSPLERFNFVYFARQYDRPLFGFAGIRSDVKHYLQALARDFSWVSIAAMFAGGFQMLAKDTLVGAYLGLAFLCEMAFVLTIGFIESAVVLYVPGYALLAIFAGVGIAFVASSARVYTRKLLQHRRLLISVFSYLWIILLSIGTTFQYWGNVHDAWNARTVSFLLNTPSGESPLPVASPGLPHEDAATLIDNLEDDAVVFTNWTMLYSYYFVAHVEEERTDMRFHELYPSGSMDGVAQSTVDYVSQNLGARPFYFDYPPGEDIADLFVFERVERGRTIYLVTGLKE